MSEFQRQPVEVRAAAFGRWLTRCEDSATHRLFSDRLYGTGVMQLNMVDATQLDAIFAALALSPGESLLDLGCGTGTVTELVARRTGAKVHGIDFAAAAIERARQRTSAATFEVVTLDDVAIEPESYDAIVSFDTFYFVDDLPKLVRKCVAGLRPGGRFVVAFSEKIHEDRPEIGLEPDRTRLAVALQAAGASFTTQEFSAEEQALWRRSLALVAELAADFAAEGNADLYDGIRDESERLVARYESGGARRYLYVVRL